MRSNASGRSSNGAAEQVQRKFGSSLLEAPKPIQNDDIVSGSKPSLDYMAAKVR